ncbi:MAG: membrane protein insertion efficiency factor YidD [Ruminococcus sp.]|nr:membrane protein insertion efficiency factor YidD [Ruminococcus sp.]MCD7801112.1 membrane protein insertion efficiency factor YidD [Ruminococcus sp.]
MLITNLLKGIFILPIRLYKRFISPLIPPVCKYYPTCSSYAITSIERFGIVRGSILAIWRILRCNPFSNGGVDYVPHRFELYLLKTRKSANIK